MIMPVANVSAVTMPDGAVYAYICGEGCLWRYHADGHGNGVRTKLTTSSAAPDSGRPVQVVVNRAEGADQIRHVFYRQPRTDNLWYSADHLPDGVTSRLPVRQLTTPSGPIQMMRTFGAAALADGVLLVGATPHRPASLQIVAVPWAALDQPTWMQGVTVRTTPLPLSSGSGAGSLDADGCEVSCDVVVGPGDLGPVLVVVAKRKDGELFRIGCWVAPIEHAFTVGSLVEHRQRWAGRGLRFASVQVLPDNSVLLSYFDHAGQVRWYTNTAVGLTGLTDPEPISPSDWIVGAADRSLAVIDQMSKGKSKHVNYGGNAFRVVVLPGEVATSPSENNPKLVDAKVPLRAGVLYYNGNGQLGELAGAGVWRYLVRTACPVVEGRELLVGIIEGPPPIPNENLNMPDRYDPFRYFNGPGYSQATFAGTQNRTTGLELTWSAGLVTKATVKATSGVEIPIIGEAKGWLQVEGSAELAYKGAYTKLKTTQTVATVVAGAEIEGDGQTQPYSVQPAGVLVFQNADWTGYQYNYQDAGGNLLDGTVAVYQLEPTNVSLYAVPYLMNPDFRPVPGRLDSYVLSADEAQALRRRSIIDLGHGTGYLTGSWGFDSKTVATFGTTTSKTTEHGFTFDLSTLVSAGMEAELLGIKGEADFGIGVEVSFESTWSGGAADGIQVGGEVWLRGNSKAPNAYTDYSYRLYLLEEDQRWTSDLLAGLVTPTFPADPLERAQQQRLAEMIAPDSQPWKLCYSLASSSFNQPLPDTLTPYWQERLTSAGVGTTYELARLLAGIPDGTLPNDPGLRRLTEELRADPDQLTDLRNAAGNGPASSEPL
ncbi:hypothetical protein Kfla_5737 [Kribbella flavida DSM 17836]|uniref:Uncharacterized protein n=2 Tax=Kribbella flavida TaxID=182640 RepID=D2PQ40_KRIFD|nr:hypothetical protein Kfla_5737 [Kribbella flavida DSM 17836]